MGFEPADFRLMFSCQDVTFLPKACTTFNVLIAIKILIGALEVWKLAKGSMID